MIYNNNFGIKQLRSALFALAASLTLASQAFAQPAPDGNMPQPQDPGLNQQMPGGEGQWGPGGGRKHRRRQIIGQGQGGQGFMPGQGRQQGGDPAQREARRQKMLKKFDTNGDGQLDQNEMAQMKAFREQKRAQRQAQGGMPGQGGQGVQGGQGQMFQPGSGRGPMGGKRRGGIRGGNHKWQQDQGAMQPGMQQPPQGLDPNQQAPNNPDGVGQIQPFQNIPPQQ